MPDYVVLGEIGISTGLLAIVCSRILFGWKKSLAHRSYKREFLGFVIAYLIFNPLSLLLAVFSIAFFPSANDMTTSLFLVLTIMILSGTSAGWFWAKLFHSTG